ncbi:MAG: hypothetical protein A2W25_16150 [candidate division Zixibacteria bacterium RBG_16_53_22]|nr:MAG: hypothetical protein A2W25_16150 [candidate division Zixibacteria bacterium RBG_16_53_22]
MNQFRRYSFKQIADSDIPLIENTAAKLGIGIKQGSRFDTYFKCIRHLAESPQIAMAKYPMDVIIAALKEVDELYGIMVNFDIYISEIYSHKIKSILTGANIPDYSERDTIARNTAFELNMAAHFKKAGFSTKLCEPDIMVTIRESEIYIACKRPASVKNLEKIIKNAKRQIIRRGKGFIALSLDKLINPSFNILEGTNTQSITDRVIDEINSFRIRNKLIIDHAADNRKIIGLIFSIGLVANDLGEGIFVTCQQIITTNLCSINSPNISIFEEIEKSFVPISF